MRAHLIPKFHALLRGKHCFDRNSSWSGLDLHRALAATALSGRAGPTRSIRSLLRNGLGGSRKNDSPQSKAKAETFQSVHRLLGWGLWRTTKLRLGFIRDRGGTRWLCWRWQTKGGRRNVLREPLRHL